MGAMIPSRRVSSKKPSVISCVSKISLLKVVLVVFYYLKLDLCFHFFVPSFEFYFRFFSFLEFSKRLHITVHRTNSIVSDFNNNIAGFQSGFLCRPAVSHTVATNTCAGKSIIRHYAHCNSAATQRGSSLCFPCFCKYQFLRCCSWRKYNA